MRVNLELMSWTIIFQVTEQLRKKLLSQEATCSHNVKYFLQKYVFITALTLLAQISHEPILCLKDLESNSLFFERDKAMFSLLSVTWLKK